MEPAAIGLAPRAFLFDLGGVCVASPFKAILDYERANHIPEGWINFSISHSAPDGAWQRLERGEIKLDSTFFADFKRDLQNSSLWEKFLQKNSCDSSGIDNSENAVSQPPSQLLPSINAEGLFWEMTKISRNPDPYMFPALQRLKASGAYLLAALSNTVILPDDHPYSNPSEYELRAYFDVFISSAHVGLRKPDPKIYQLALSEMRRTWQRRGREVLRPDEVVFLDDIGENLKAAKVAGMRTIRVQLGKTKEAVLELEDLTGLSLMSSSKVSSNL